MRLCRFSHAGYREARENRNQAGKARTEAFKVRQSADDKIEQIRNEAKSLLSRGELSAEEAKRTSNRMISEVQAEAERKCKVLRERHNEQEILVGKLMASSESLSSLIPHEKREVIMSRQYLGLHSIPGIGGF